MTDLHRTTGAPVGAPAPEALQDGSLNELLRTATSDLSTLFRQELELAKVEIKSDVRQAGKVGGMFGAGAISAHLALLFVSFALAWSLDEVMHRALAFLIVAVVYGIVAAVLFMRGRDEAKNLNPVPEQTVETLKEDVQWAKQRKS